MIAVGECQGEICKQGSDPIAFTDRFATQQNVRGHTLGTSFVTLKACSIRCGGGSGLAAREGVVYRADGMERCVSRGREGEAQCAVRARPVCRRCWKQVGQR
jgi:hypothetical protein